MPTTAHEALLAELLGDTGKLHDDIKRMPGAFREALAPELSRLVKATHGATTAINTAGRAKADELDAQAAQLRADWRRECAGYREATQEALRQEVTAAAHNAAITIEGARRTITVPLWIAATAGGGIGGVVVALTVWLLMGGPA